jgi:acetolactate synthase-1/2/3 large subunit
MKASDYIVEFLIKNGIRDVFGYPGGMVTHLMESLDKYREKISAHINYHEQAAAMAACGWAEITGLPGVAYATSGPGATNLLTGVACAYFESLPCVFITGQVNTYEQKQDVRVRQKGFQETDIVSMAKPVTKDAFMVSSAEELPEKLKYAFSLAQSGRKGPVLVDIPMNVFRGEVQLQAESAEEIPFESDADKAAADIIGHLRNAKRPVVLAGHGISVSKTRESFRAFVKAAGIPVVTSMIAVDVLPSDSEYSYGMIGAYGLRYANYIIDHSDCILTLGSRLDCRQTGVTKRFFAPGAKILRVDIDEGEMENKAHEDEIQYAADLKALMPRLCEAVKGEHFDFSNWIDTCKKVKSVLKDADAGNPGNEAAKSLGKLLPDDAVITTDVGQNQVWIAQAMECKENQRVLFSGGHGAMGYSLPAAIGAALASHKPVICCVGDGGLQMNIQELEFIVRERLPIKIVLFNNSALGMIHHFQEMYFNSNYVQTDNSKGYTVPDFSKVASAYGLRAVSFEEGEDKIRGILADPYPAFVTVHLPQTTHVFPKLGLNQPIHVQEPPLPETIKNELEQLLGDSAQ